MAAAADPGTGERARPKGEASQRARAFLGVGSSLDPEENIPAALGLLLGTPGVEITGLSTFYRTPPLPAPGAPPESVAQDPDFLNGVVKIRTDLSPETLTEALDTIESALGRVRTGYKYAPRTLDLDLLVYLPAPPTGAGTSSPPRGTAGGSEKSVHPRKGKEAEAPEHPIHPDVLSRPWVALPLLELEPELLLPMDGIPLRDVAGRFPDAGGEADEDLSEGLRRRFLPAVSGFEGE